MGSFVSQLQSGCRDEVGPFARFFANLYRKEFLPFFRDYKVKFRLFGLEFDLFSPQKRQKNEKSKICSINVFL